MNLNPIGWPSAVLRLLARLDSDGVNSTTPVTEINGGTISATNADIALVAKGTGATLAQVPDGTVAGGNKRGAGATDWQKSRNSSDHVASAPSSTIGGGERNRASGSWGTVGGGFLNVASGDYSGVATGRDNFANSGHGFVGGGQTNGATAGHATVCGGQNNIASGGYSVVGGGVSNTASDSSATVAGGESNTANSAYSFIAGGRRGTTRSIIGNHVLPACNSPVASISGASQTALLILGRQTTDATATVLASNSSAANFSNQVTLPNNSAYSFSGEVIAGVTGGGNTARWTINGAIKRGANAASTVMVGTPTVTMTHFDAGAATWVVAVTANTAIGCITITVTGAAATTIRWVCRIDTTEMTF
jgi:hypothetical protein